MKLYLASGNPHKAQELQSLADAFGSEARPGRPGRRIEVVSAAEVGGMPPVVEDTGTFVGNARIKALALKPRLPEEAWALADDSGLCVQALGGQPGVDSAYFAGPEGDAAANLAKLVRSLRGVEASRRGAEFVCILFLAGPAGVEQSFEGRCRGVLAPIPRGLGGFGYDPLFVPSGLNTTLAELPSAVKNRISHRALAWAACADWLAARA